jgi:hypothetical protein
MFLIVCYRDLHLRNPSPADYEHYRPFKWWLIPHGITGALALFLGPTVFEEAASAVSQLASLRWAHLRLWGCDRCSARRVYRIPQIRARHRIVAAGDRYGGFRDTLHLHDGNGAERNRRATLHSLRSGTGT